MILLGDHESSITIADKMVNQLITHAITTNESVRENVARPNF